MSLQVWLPLNGDLRNQGLSDVTITNNGATVNANGKIGECYSFDGSDDLISINCSDLYKTFSGGTQQFSVAFWVYHADATRAVIFGDYGLVGTIQFNIELTTGHQIRFYWAANPDKNFAAATAIAASTWTHIVLTYDGNKVNLYKNGILQSDSWSGTLATKNKTTGLFYLGRDSRTGGTVLNGRLNDFRIYDHCLSAKEIKEISKGLVLHMPLAPPGGENLILNSRNITTSNYALTRATADGEKITLTPTTSASYLKYKATNVPYGDYKNKTYTVSFYARRISGNSEYTEKGVICYFGVNPTNRINNTLSQSYDKYRNLLTINTITNEWGFYSFTATIPDDLTSGVDSAIVDTSMITFQLAVSGSGLPVEVIPIKFEIGDHPTPWTPNPADPEYAAMGFNDGIEYDVSGYGHNGIKYGDITPNTTTPRYNACSLLNSNTSYIVISGLNTTGFSNSYSISWWAKVTDYGGKMMWGFADGVRLNGIYYGNIWNTGDGSNNPIYQPGTTTQVSAPTGNTWHHFVMTGNGTKNYLYVDGILYGESKTYKTITGTTIYINGWSSATAYRYQNYFHISDFRIYATALSAEDILALYNTPESLTNTGALLTQGEFVEV